MKGLYQFFETFMTKFHELPEQPKYNIYMYVVWGEMLKQTNLTLFCAIIKDVKIQQYRERVQVLVNHQALIIPPAFIPRDI